MASVDLRKSMSRIILLLCLIGSVSLIVDRIMTMVDRKVRSGPVSAALSRDSQLIDFSSDPVQITDTTSQPITVSEGNRTILIQPMARYMISCRVMGKTSYPQFSVGCLSGREWNDKISPLDFILAWERWQILNTTDT